MVCEGEPALFRPRFVGSQKPAPDPQEIVAPLLGPRPPQDVAELSEKSRVSPFSDRVLRALKISFAMGCEKISAGTTRTTSAPPSPSERRCKAPSAPCPGFPRTDRPGAAGLRYRRGGELPGGQDGHGDAGPPGEGRQELVAEDRVPCLRHDLDGLAQAGRPRGRVAAAEGTRERSAGTRAGAASTAFRSASGPFS